MDEASTFKTCSSETVGYSRMDYACGGLLKSRTDLTMLAAVKPNTNAIIL